MSKQMKRAVIIEFLRSLSFTCDKCGSSVKPVLKCKNCKAPVKASEMHFHHILPLSMGGKEDLSNIILLCSTCHANVDRIRLKKLKMADKKLTAF